MLLILLFLFVQVNALNLKTQPFQQRVSDVKPVKQSYTAVPPMASSHQTGSPRPPGNNIVEINNNSTAGFHFYIFLVYVWVNTWMEFVAFLASLNLFCSIFLFQLRVTPSLLQICLWMPLLTSLYRLSQNLGL